MLAKQCFLVLYLIQRRYVTPAFVYFTFNFLFPFWLVWFSQLVVPFCFYSQWFFDSRGSCIPAQDGWCLWDTVFQIGLLSGWWLSMALSAVSMTDFACRSFFFFFFWNWWPLTYWGFLGYFISLENTFFSNAHSLILCIDAQWFLHIRFTIFINFLIVICILFLWHCIRISRIRCSIFISLLHTCGWQAVSFCLVFLYIRCHEGHFVSSVSLLAWFFAGRHCFSRHNTIY